MDTTWFKERLAEKKLSQRALSKLMELDPAAVSLMLRGMRRMTPKEAHQLAVILGFDVTEVLRRAGVPVTEDITMATVVGTIDSAHNVSMLPAASQHSVVAPPECYTNTLVLQTRDRATLRDGWLYFVSPVREQPETRLGQLSIIHVDGHTVLGWVTSAYLTGKFNVTSGHGEDLAVDAEPDWVSPVLWVKPNVHK